MRTLRAGVLICILFVDPFARAYGQWNEIYSPFGAEIHSLVALGGTVIAGTMYDGLFRTTNGGRTWKQVNTGLLSNDGSYYVYSLAVSGSALFAGTAMGAFRSTDNGDTWTQTIDGLTDSYIESLCLRGGTLIAGTNSGIFISTDNGTGWTYTFSAPAVLALAASDSFVFGTPYGNGVLRSGDNGLNWDIVLEGQIYDPFRAVAARGRTVVAGSDLQGVLRSPDNGITWAQTPLQQQILGLRWNASSAFAGTGSGVYRSTDDGQTWTATNAGLPQTAVFAFESSGPELVAGTSAGAFRSTDNGTHWSNMGLSSRLVSTFLAVGTNLFIGTKGGGVWVTPNGASSWQHLNNGMPFTVVHSLALSGNDLFAGTEEGLFHSTSKGSAWTRDSLLLTGPVLALVVDSIAPGTITLFAGTEGNGIYRSTNAGTSWEFSGLAASSVTALAARHPTIVAGTSNGTYRSTDGGISWTPSTAGLPGTSVGVLAFSAAGLFAGTPSGVFLSTDDGQLWNQAGLTGLPTDALAVTEGGVFAGTDSSGIFLSTDNGGSWSAVSPGLTATSVSALAVYGENLMAAVGSGGIRRRPLSQMITGVEGNEGKFSSPVALAPGYPNPFNPTTTILFTLPSRLFVSMRVYDILGREVATLVSEALPAGSHSRQWNAAHMPAGMYLCRLQAGGHVAAQRLLLLK